MPGRSLVCSSQTGFLICIYPSRAILRVQCNNSTVTVVLRGNKTTRGQRVATTRTEGDVIYRCNCGEQREQDESDSWERSHVT